MSKLALKILLISLFILSINCQSDDSDILLDEEIHINIGENKT